jgi:hypothetical protein
MLADDRSTASEDAATRRSSAARSWTWSRPGGRSPRSPGRWGTSAQSSSTWRRQDRIDKGLLAGLSSHEHHERVAARRRIAQLGTELAVTRRAAELLKEQASPLDGSRPPGDGRPGAARAALLPGAGGLPVWLLCLAASATVAASDPPRLADRCIHQVHAASRQSDGSRRVHAELTWAAGSASASHAVELLLRRAGRRGVTGRPRSAVACGPRRPPPTWLSVASPAPAATSGG